jgi:hypothetical protein
MPNFQEKTMFHLINDIIDAQVLHELINEDLFIFIKEQNPNKKNALKTRIIEAKKFKTHFLTILN